MFNILFCTRFVLLSLIRNTILSVIDKTFSILIYHGFKRGVLIAFTQLDYAVRSCVMEIPTQFSFSMVAAAICLVYAEAYFYNLALRKRNCTCRRLLQRSYWLHAETTLSTEPVLPPSHSIKQQLVLITFDTGHLGQFGFQRHTVVAIFFRV